MKRRKRRLFSGEFTCIICGEPFAAKRFDATTCSTRCRSRKYRGWAPITHRKKLRK